MIFNVFFYFEKEEMSRNDEKELLIRFVFVAPLTLLFLVKENFRRLDILHI